MTTRSVQIRAERREIGGKQLSVLMARGRDGANAEKWAGEPQIVAFHVPAYQSQFVLTVVEEVKKDIHDWWRDASCGHADFIGPEDDVVNWVGQRAEKFRKEGRLTCEN